MDEFKVPDITSILVRGRPTPTKDHEINQSSRVGWDVGASEKNSSGEDSSAAEDEEKIGKPEVGGFVEAKQKSTNEDKSINIKRRSEKAKVSTPEAIFAALTYEEPINKAAADTRYKLEVIKNGSIVDNVTFKDRSCYVVGRIPGCDIAAEHPTVSRIHAILQFIGSKSVLQDESIAPDGITAENVVLEKGLYVYDLNSTHGTFLNKNRMYPNRFYRLHVGHVIKFGNSSRLYIVEGPPEDEEEESSMTVTELLQEKLNKELERKRLEEEGRNNDPEITSTTSGEENEGIDWGMGEDADEETDVRENPFAMDFDTSDLNLDNPKKTLRGWFEREGCELEYDVREKANGQFICTINLPIDGENGRPIFAEVDVKGKKKDAVAQCALQACQILDKYGLLRQSHRENRKKRKMKNKEEEDFYSSDEDTFLDRTGSVEKKREKRMKLAGKIQDKSENYESLSSQYEVLQEKIDDLNKKLSIAEKKSQEDSKNVDPLDAFMSDLKAGSCDIKKIKTQLKEVVLEQNKVKKLMNLTKPVALPSPLIVKEDLHIATATSKTVTATETEEDNKPEESEKEKKSKEDIIKEIKLHTDTTTPTNKVQKLYGPKMQFKFLKQTVLQKPAAETDINPSPSSSKVVVEENDSDTEVQPNNSNDNIDENLDDSISINKPEEDEDKLEDNVDTPDAKPKRKRHRYIKKDKEKDMSHYDSNNPDYSTWVPPQDQRGDGRTSLNEKLGY